MSNEEVDVTLDAGAEANANDAAAADAATVAPAHVAAIVGAPDLVIPWLDRFYDSADEWLVAAAASGPGAAPARLDALPPGVLERAVRRAVLDRDEAGAFTPASFRDRFDIWAMFEGWKDVPPAVHRQLADWELGNYTESMRKGLEALKDRRQDESDEADYTYLLLTEAEALIAAEPHVYLWPCDCRAIFGRCRKPVNVCLRFDNDRGLGWEISRERAAEILHAADRAGLMHTGEPAGSAAAPGAICNCCSDCCFPHLATELLETGDVWPVRRHVAVIDKDTCKPCGRCARRCPFAAITADSVGRPTLEPAACRGCGLCSTGCPAEAIVMRPLAASV